MGNSYVKGRTITLKQPARVLYEIFSDLRNFAKNLPADMQEKAALQADQDSLVGKVQGFEVGIKVDERSPFNFVRYVQYGATPISFNFWVYFDSVDEFSTNFHLELDAELSSMMKMMLGGKLQDMIDKLTDEIEKGLGASV